MTIPLQKGIIYGPVSSRRLGRSLGINLLPTDVKICSFNCLYCQYGWTKVHERKPGDEHSWHSVTEVRQAVKEALQTISPPPAYLTFSGNGEPTLHPQFPEIVDEIIKLRDRFSPVSKTAILSNSSTVSDEKVRPSLSKLDVPIMKLDAGLSRTFKRYNRPNSGIVLEQIVEGLKQLQDITIQTLFSGGTAGNYHPENIEAWLEKIQNISPADVQLYTLDRPFPGKNIEPVNQIQLNEIKNKLTELGISAEVYI